MNAAIGVYEGIEAYKEGDENKASKCAVDVAMSGVATFGGIPGLIVGGTFFGLDAIGAFDSGYTRNYSNPSRFFAPDNTRIFITKPK